MIAAFLSFLAAAAFVLAMFAPPRSHRRLLLLGTVVIACAALLDLAGLAGGARS